MSVWSSLVIVLAVAVMTYVMRAGVIVALADRSIPVPVERALRYVGPSVLAALAINLAAGGVDGPNLEIAEAAGLIVAGAVAVWRRNLIWALLAGMTTLWVLSAIV